MTKNYENILDPSLVSHDPDTYDYLQKKFDGRVLAPTSEDELRDIVVNHEKVRVVGHGCCNSSHIVEDASTIVSLCHYPRLMTHDDETVIVGGGVTASEMNHYLASNRLGIPLYASLPILPVVSMYASHYSTLMAVKQPRNTLDHLLWIELMQSDGRIKKMKSTARNFGRVLTSMGAYGVIVKIGIQRCPAMKLSVDTTIMRARDYPKAIASVMASDLDEMVFLPDLGVIKYDKMTAINAAKLSGNDNRSMFIGDPLLALFGQNPKVLVALAPLLKRLPLPLLKVAAEKKNSITYDPRSITVDEIIKSMRHLLRKMSWFTYDFVLEDAVEGLGILSDHFRTSAPMTLFHCARAGKTSISGTTTDDTDRFHVITIHPTSASEGFDYKGSMRALTPRLEHLNYRCSPHVLLNQDQKRPDYDPRPGDEKFMTDFMLEMKRLSRERA